MKKRLLKLFAKQTVIALVFMLLLSASAFAQSWKFAVMSDTQWPNSPDTKNPNSVAVNVINHLNQEFIRHGVKLVVAVGDVTDNGSTLALDTRATFAQTLYDAGIGFYPVRGNHESSATGATEFKRIFPQTQTGTNNLTPANALVTTAYYGIPPAVSSLPFTMGSGFNSPAAIDPNYAGLSYSFDYDNARFVLLDQFSIPNVACNLIENQQPWITSTLANRTPGTHAFVFAHKGLITENHADILFGPNCNGSSSKSNPAVKPDAQNEFIRSLHENGVRYYMGGHDHMHNRAIVTSPDGASTVQNIIAASDSYKFYIPQNPSNDDRYNVPAFGFERELPIAQELFTIGYYIVTVDGPRVTVDFYSSPNGCNGDCDETNDIIPYTFTKRESFGYSLNGKEFLVPQGETYTVVQDNFGETAAQILGGSNGSKMVDFSSRALTKTVDTGWTADNGDLLASNILTLWGMTNNLGACDISDPNCQPTRTSNVQPNQVSGQTDEYVLAMTYDQKRVRPIHLGNGGFGIAARDSQGNWVNAVDMNVGGAKGFVVGPWKQEYQLGTYGVDPSTRTAWAVINYNGDFAVARNIEDVPGKR
jgi:hypothetical protein